MPRPCTICPQPDRSTVEQALQGAVSLRTIAVQYTVSKTSLLRHQRHEEVAPRPIKAPTWRYHPTLPARMIETHEDLAALEAADPAWRERPYGPST